MDSGNLSNIELRTLTPLFSLRNSQKLPLPELKSVINWKWDFCPDICSTRLRRKIFHRPDFTLRDRGLSHAIAKHNIIDLCNRGLVHLIAKQKMRDFYFRSTYSKRTRPSSRVRESLNPRATWSRPAPYDREAQNATASH